MLLVSLKISQYKNYFYLIWLNLKVLISNQLLLFKINFEEKGNLDFKNSFDSIQNEEKIILLTSLGLMTNEEAIKINSRLKMIHKNVEGIILLDS